jgi:hypothetical protein
MLTGQGLDLQDDEGSDDESLYASPAVPMNYPRDFDNEE